MIGVLFVTPQPLVALISDTSDLGWGAHLNNLRIEGFWSREDLSLHIKSAQGIKLSMPSVPFLDLK